VLDMTTLARQEESKGRALDDGHKAVPDFTT
jgi:hypothetical protein